MKRGKKIIIIIVPTFVCTSRKRTVIPLAAIFCGKSRMPRPCNCGFSSPLFPTAFHLAAAKGLLSDFWLLSSSRREGLYISSKKAGANSIFSRIFLFLARGNNCASGAEEKATEVGRGKYMGKEGKENRICKFPSVGST